MGPGPEVSHSFEDDVDIRKPKRHCPAHNNASPLASVTSSNGTDPSDLSSPSSASEDLTRWPFLTNILDLDARSPTQGSHTSSSPPPPHLDCRTLPDLPSPIPSGEWPLIDRCLTSSATSIQRLGLPTFIQPLPTSLNAEDIAYLRTKGAFRVPQPRLMNELARQYVLHMHPYIPIIDLSEFLSAICGGDESAKLDLLLFQAIMFAGIAFVDLQYLQEEGYQSRRAAIDAFYRRARLLCEFDFGAQRVPTLQALLLLTYWVEPPHEPKGPSHWTGLCVSLVHMLGLHPGPVGATEPVKGYRLRKCLWWSCFMRDQLISIGMGRHPRMVAEQNSSLRLHVYDLYTEPLPDNARHLLGPSYLNDPRSCSLFAQMFVSMIDLCVCVNHVLRTQYRIQSSEIESRTGIVLLVPRPGKFQDVMKWDSELESIGKRQSRNYSLEDSEKAGTVASSDAKLLASYQGLLEMLRYSILSTLHRPYITSMNSEIAPELITFSNRRTAEAAQGICATIETLTRMDMVRFLPPTAVTVMLSPITYYLQQIRKSPPSQAKVFYSHIQSCRRALLQLQTMYATADAGKFFMETAANALRIRLPTSPAPAQELKDAGDPSTARALFQGSNRGIDEAPKVANWMDDFEMLISSSKIIDSSHYPGSLFPEYGPSYDDLEAQHVQEPQFTTDSDLISQTRPQESTNDRTLSPATRDSHFDVATWISWSDQSNGSASDVDDTHSSIRLASKPPRSSVITGDLEIDLNIFAESTGSPLT